MEKYFIFGTAVVNGYKETVYLNKEGKSLMEIDEDELMLFDSEAEAIKYIDSHGLIAECDKLSNF